MVACYLEMHVSPLQVQIATKIQRLYLCFRGLAFHWDPREYYATISEVENTNMGASKREMHIYIDIYIYIYMNCMYV